MDSIDELLAQLKSEYEKPQPQQQRPKSPAAKPLKQPPAKSASFGIDNLLAEVQADFAAQDAAEDLRKQQELAQEQIRQAQLKAQQLEALRKPAKEWLAKLDPLSSEGLWFDGFAKGFPSRLDAAIEYLQSNE